MKWFRNELSVSNFYTQVSRRASISLFWVMKLMQIKCKIRYSIVLLHPVARLDYYDLFENDRIRASVPIRNRVEKSSDPVTVEKHRNPTSETAWKRYPYTWIGHGYRNLQEINWNPNPEPVTGSSYRNLREISRIPPFPAVRIWPGVL